MRIGRFCVDLDRDGLTKTQFNNLVEHSRKKCEKFGEIYADKKSTNDGWHIKVILKRKVSFWRSIEIRSYCGDDPKRCFYDIMRYRAGSKMVDTCFDIKKVQKGIKLKLNKKRRTKK